MDARSPPAASTPGNSQVSTEGESRTHAKVPSPIMDSDLAKSDESTIVDASSLEDLSMTVQYEKDQEDTTIIDSSVANTSGVYQRTRSKDGTPIPPSVTNFMMEGLLSKLKCDIDGAEEIKDEF